MTWRRAGADAGHNHSAAPLPQRRVRAVLPPALTASLDAGRHGRAQEYKNVGRNAELRNFADISISACGRSPRSPKTSPAPELCKAVSVSRQIASHWRKPIVTKARLPRPPGGRTRATRVRSSSGPCARTRDEIERPVSPLASHRLGWTCPTALPPASRAGRAPKLPLEQADERHATAGSLVR